MSKIETFKTLLEKGPDSAMLRYSLANAYAAEKEFDSAVEHLQVAVEQDARFSAAWKLLGKCLLDTEQYGGAIEAYEQGIVVAADKGDKQAEKEMQVFLKRARKKLDAG